MLGNMAAATLADLPLVPGMEYISDFPDAVRHFMRQMNHRRYARTLMQNGDVYRFKVSNVRYVWPQLTPEEVICRGETYQFKVMYDSRLYFNGELHSEHKGFEFELPCPTLGSQCIHRRKPPRKPHQTICGVFVIKGRMRYFPLRQLDKKSDTAMVYFTSLTRSQNRRATVEFRAVHQDKKYRSTSTLTCQVTPEGQVPSSSKQMVVGWSFIPKQTKLPFMVVAVAMGWTREQVVAEMTHLIGTLEHADRYLMRLRYSCVEVKSKGDALDIIADIYSDGKKMPTHEAVQNTLNNEVLPNMKAQSIDDRMRQLCLFMSYAVFLNEDKIEPMKTSMYAFKQIETSSAILGLFLRMQILTLSRNSLILRAVQSLRNAVFAGKEVNLSRLFSSARITDATASMVASGAFSDRKRNVTQAIFTGNDYNRVSQISTMRRVVSWLRKKNGGRHFDRRKVMEDSYGFTGAAMTPDGRNCGYVHELAAFAGVTTASNPMPMLRRVLDIRPQDQPFEDAPGQARLFDNTGAWVGWVRDRESTVRKIRSLRRRLVLNVYTAVYVVFGDIHLQSSAGRMCRLLVVCENAHLYYNRTWDLTLNNMLAHGLVEWVTPPEVAELFLVSRYHHDPAHPEHHPLATHCELANYSHLCRAVAYMPWSNHTQCPRLTTSASSRRQVATGDIQGDAGIHSYLDLVNGQKPIVHTKAMQDMKEEEYATTTNLVVAIASHPYTQEDSNALNKFACDRGALHSMRRHQYSCDNTEAVFGRPSPDDCSRLSCPSYEKVHPETGVPEVGTELRPDDPAIGAMRPSHNSEKKFTDISVITKRNGTGYVTRVLDFNQRKLVDVKSLRQPQLGDKFTTHHAQKNTLGMIVPGADMYFCEDGMSIDCLVQAEAFPSRMTIGQLIEMIVATAAAVGGKIMVDDQIMKSQEKPKTYLEARKMLQDAGMSQWCETMLYSGVTGEPIGRDNETFMVGILPIFVLRQKGDKGYCRTHGPVNMWRQPTEGRRHNGSARFGIQEGEVTAEHGAMAMLDQILRANSDAFDVYMCKRCGRICEVNDDCVNEHGEKHIVANCVQCLKNDQIRRVAITYAFHMFLHEMRAANIVPKFQLEDVDMPSLSVEPVRAQIVNVTQENTEPVTRPTTYKVGVNLKRKRPDDERAAKRIKCEE